MKKCYVLMLIISFCISTFAQTSSIHVEAGWNLLSLPVRVADGTKDALFPTAKSKAFVYQSSYQAVDTLQNGQGFWLKFDSAQTISLAGGVSFDDTIEVNAGWNMIGSLTNPIAVSTIKTDTSGLIVSDFYCYTSGSYHATDTLQPGFGYWVKVKQNGSIMLSSPQPEIIQYEPGDSTVFPSRVAQLSNTIIDSTSVILEYTGSAPDFEVGQYIVDTIGQGYCRKITAVQNNGSTITISTQNALLTDAFKNLRIKKYIHLQPSSVSDFRKTYNKAFDTTYSRQQNGQLYTIHLTSNEPRFLPNQSFNATNFDFTYEWTNLTIKVSLPDQKLAFSFTADTLLFAMNLSVDADIQIDWFTLKYLKFVPVVDNSTILKRSNVQFHLGVTDTPELTLLTLPGPPIVLGPVVLTTSIFVKIGCDINAQLNIPWGADIVGSGDSHIEAGAEWSDGTFNPIVANNQWITGEIKNNNADGTFSITSRPFVKAGANFQVYGILGPDFYFKLGFPVTFSMPPLSCGMKAELSAGATLKFNDILPIPFKFDLNRVLWDETIFSGCGTSTNASPLQPSNPTPIDNATNISTSPTLSWTCTDPEGDPLTYDVYLGTDNPPTTAVSSNQNGSGLSRSGLTGGQTYYWKIVAKDDHNNSTIGPVWRFTTGSDSCIPFVPWQTHPSNGATNQPTNLRLGYNGGTVAPFSCRVYSITLQVSIDSLFSTYFYNQSGLADTGQQVTGLSSETKYFWRVCATSNFGSSGWSTVWSFTTSSGGGGSPCVGIPTITYAGKTYNTVQIGSQCWLKENLDVGIMISGDVNESDNDTIEKYCYDNNSANCDTYGSLYQWNEAMQYSTTPGARGICPSGWHIPTYAEFQTLNTAVGGDGNALKEIGQGTGGGVGTNTSGFSALLSGYRDSGYFTSLGYSTFFWSSTWNGAYVAYYMSLNFNGSTIYFYDIYKEYGFSVRCLKD